jgi:ATP-dependent Clp protease ATP-binding subunit ClpA
MRKRGIDPTEARRALRSAIRRETTSKVNSSTSVLSENTEAALSAAKRLARQEGAGKVRERHLLQAIMDTPDAGAKLVLELVGMDRRHVVVEEDSGVSKTSASADDFHKARFGSRANIEILDADGWLALGSFDEDCRASLEASRRAVAEMGQQQIRTPHLFLGMLQRDNSAVASRLRQGGVDVSQLTNVFWSQVAKSSDGASVSVELHRDSFSEDTLDTLRAAGRTAARSGEAIISEQRVLGTLVEGESVVARTLEDSGVDSDLLFR